MAAAQELFGASLNQIKATRLAGLSETSASQSTVTLKTVACTWLRRSRHCGRRDVEVCSTNSESFGDHLYTRALSYATLELSSPRLFQRR